MDTIQMNREGNKVTLRSLLSPKQPASVIVPSATTRAKVPASVDSNPPLYVPRASRDDITRERRDRLTPATIDNVDEKGEPILLFMLANYHQACQSLSFLSIVIDHLIISFKLLSSHLILALPHFLNIYLKLFVQVLVQ